MIMYEKIEAVAMTEADIKFENETIQTKFNNALNQALPTSQSNSHEILPPAIDITEEQSLTVTKQTSVPP